MERLSTQPKERNPQNVLTPPPTHPKQHREQIIQQRGNGGNGLLQDLLLLQLLPQSLHLQLGVVKAAL
jgi:hypothetical protein